MARPGVFLVPVLHGVYTGAASPHDPAGLARRLLTSQGAPPLDIPAEPLGWLAQRLFGALCAPSPLCGVRCNGYKVRVSSRITD